MILFFFFFPGANDNTRTEQQYFGAVDSIEPIDEENSQIIFDSIVSDSLPTLSQTNMWEAQEQITPHILLGTIRNIHLEYLRRQTRSKQIEGKWFKIRTTAQETEFPVSRSIENSESPESSNTYIHSVQYLKRSDPISASLSTFFSFSGYHQSNQRAIKRHFEQINPGLKIHKHNVFNVGQGSLTAVTDIENVPIFYFDLGGAWWIFPGNYPVTLNLCPNGTKTVIISHWDMDHLETARRLFYQNPNLLHDFTWIAPKQNLTPMYARLAARMASTGNLLLWSGTGNNRIDFWAGALLKCNGVNKNNSGIALLIDCKDHSIKQVLNPGDADFQSIPGIRTFKLDGLVATHHGANFDFGNVPNSSTKKGAIAFSHGNRYGHPTNQARLTYRNSGWTTDRETPNEHISFSKTPSNINVPCNGRICSLTITQTY